MMKSLSKTWLTDPWIDTEYKSYVLLAYLQEVGINFEQQKLYPYLTELIDHFREVKLLKQSADDTQDQFPKAITGIDLENFRLSYEKVIGDHTLMEEVLRTVDFSLPHIEAYIKEGKEIYEFVERHISISPVGLIPLNTQEGYFFIENRRDLATEVYEYQLTIFENVQDKYRSIRTEFLHSYPMGLKNSFPHIKSDLLRNRKSLPNPAVYGLESEIAVPFNECLLPIAKRMLVKVISE